MALPNLSVSLYPNVPNLPGVPPVLRAPGQSLLSTAVSLVESDAVGVLQSIFAPVWGVFDDTGAPVVVSDTTLMLEYQSDSVISNYPQEQGAFGLFNKVQMPYRTTVTLVCGQSVGVREAFLSAIDAAKQSTDLYTVVSPEATYENANIVNYDYRRTTRNGATLLIVNLHIEEVRQTGTAQFSQTGDVSLPASGVQNPASADSVSQGQVQPQTPTAAQSALFGPVSVESGVGGVQ
jgi:hypothetical protein